MSTIEQSVQAAFGAVAANYASSAVHAAGEDLNRMVALAGLTGAERVLDAGSGAGHTALAFAPHVREVVAYDLTPAMLAQVERLARERGLQNVTTRQGDVAALPFTDSEFDRVVSRYSAHHWPRPAEALAEFRRVLKPGGLFLLSDIVAPEAPLLDTWLQSLELLRDPSHVRDHRVSEWRALMDAAGFATSVGFEWTLPLAFGAWVERINTPAPNVEMLGALMTGAPAEVRSAFEMTFNEGAHGRLVPAQFSIPGALFVGVCGGETA